MRWRVPGARLNRSEGRLPPGGPGLGAAERSSARRTLTTRALPERCDCSMPPGAGVQRVVYAGSSSAYGNQPASSKRETDLPKPLSPYAAAKLAGEQYCQSFYATYGLETVVIRYFNVFGPRQDPKSEYSAVIPKFVTTMLAGRRPTIFGDGLQSRDFTYVDNVVFGNLRAAESLEAAGRIINVACGRQYSLLDLVEAINRVLGTSLDPLFKSARAGDVRESLADISLARQLLDYRPVVGFEDGLRRSIEYYRTLVL